MNRGERARQIGFKVSVAVGLLLGIMLLVQSVFSYYYVSRRLVEQASLREAERKVASLERLVRSAGTRDALALAAIIEELRTESPKQVAWIRITDPNGAVVAATAAEMGAPIAAERVRQAFEERRTPFEIRETENGRVMVSVHRLRLIPRAGAGDPPDPNRVSPPDRRAQGDGSFGPRMGEIALYLDSFSAPFGTLQRNLLVSLSAAGALVTAMIILMLHFRRYLRGKQLDQQLELARRVQGDLQPPSTPVSTNLDFAAACVPAWQVGGDFYDIFATEGDRVAVALGDVSGKGMSAALLMALIHGALRSSPWTSSAWEHEQAARRLNDLLCTKSSPERFATLFWCYFDPVTSTLRYISAGHPPPALVRGNEHSNLEVVRLTEAGPVLGILPEADYSQAQVRVNAGDLLVIFSDGIAETTNDREEEFGEDRLLSLIRENAERAPEAIRDVILERVRAFLGTQPPGDDLTLMVIRFEQTPHMSAPVESLEEDVWLKTTDRGHAG